MLKVHEDGSPSHYEMTRDAYRAIHRDFRGTMRDPSRLANGGKWGTVLVPVRYVCSHGKPADDTCPECVDATSWIFV
jgi:hypothetical protein